MSRPVNTSFTIVDMERFAKCIKLVLVSFFLQIAYTSSGRDVAFFNDDFLVHFRIFAIKIYLIDSTVDIFEKR